MVVQCPYCQYKEVLPEEYAGMVAQCPKCGKDFQIAKPKTLQPARPGGVQIINIIIPSLIISVVFALAILWLNGYMTAASDSEDGQSLIGYKMRRNSMNFISAEGYTYYFKQNTNMDSVRQSVEEESRKAARELEEATKQLEQSLKEVQLY